MEKGIVREQMRIKRRNLPQAQRFCLQARALARLLAAPEFRQAQWIYPFVSCGSEIDTTGLIRILLSGTAWHVAVPRVRGNEMDFIEIHDWRNLKTGAMGILEPTDGKTVIAERGVMLMPGLAFDRRGNRVGYGAGYYDRYLERHESASLYTMAYAFDFQVVDQIDTAVDKKLFPRGKR